VVVFYTDTAKSKAAAISDASGLLRLACPERSRMGSQLLSFLSVVL